MELETAAVEDDMSRILDGVQAGYMSVHHATESEYSTYEIFAIALYFRLSRSVLIVKS